MASHKRKTKMPNILANQILDINEGQGGIPSHPLTKHGRAVDIGVPSWTNRGDKKKENNLNSISTNRNLNVQLKIQIINTLVSSVPVKQQTVNNEERSRSIPATQNLLRKMLNIRYPNKDLEHRPSQEDTPTPVVSSYKNEKTPLVRTF